MDQVAQLVKPSEDTEIGALSEEAFNESVELLVQVGLISEALSYNEIVDSSVYEAVSGAE